MLGLAKLLADVGIRIPVEYASEFRRDIVYGARMLAASPGFTAVALLSLGLGIGIATCSYSEMNGFVLRDLPGAERTEELVTLVMPTSYPHYKRFRDSNDLFSSTAAYIAPVPFGISYGGRLERTWGHLVTTSYFSTLGVRPELGRFFDAGQDAPGQPPSVVVSYRFWENQLGSDPSAIGQDAARQRAPGDHPRRRAEGLLRCHARAVCRRPLDAPDRRGERARRNWRTTLSSAATCRCFASSAG